MSLGLAASALLAPHILPAPCTHTVPKMPVSFPDPCVLPGSCDRILARSPISPHKGSFLLVVSHTSSALRGCQVHLMGLRPQVQLRPESPGPEPTFSNSSPLAVTGQV